MAERGLTLRALERASGVSNAFLSRMIRKEKPPSAAALHKVTEALGLPTDYFLEVRRDHVARLMDRDPVLVDEIYDRYRDL